MVSPARHQKHQLARNDIVHRCHDRHIGQMRPAAERIVRHVNVAGTDVRHVGQNVPNGLAHRSKMNRNVRRVDDEVACRSEDRTAEIEPLLHVGRQRRFLQSDTHLLGDGREEVVEDFQQNRIRSRAVAPGSLFSIQ